jgi:Zn finger protein HypA/HybF involved in hydrogenase expression
MHEFAIVQSLVRELIDHLGREGIEKVASVRLRRGSTFSDEALRQSYLALSKGTILEGSELSVEMVNLNFRCPCGHAQVITSDDLVGHMFVCPACGKVKEIDEAHDLELVDVVAEKKDGRI